MSRRNSSTLKDIYGLFILTPWWVPLVVASFVYVIFSLIIPTFDRNNMLNLLSKIVGNYLSFLILLVGVCSWIGKWWRSKHQLNYNLSDTIRRKTNDNYVASGLLSLPWWGFLIIGVLLSFCVYQFFSHISINLSGGVLLNLSMFNFILIPIILFSAGYMSYSVFIAKKARNRLLEKQQSIDSINKLSWRQFEILIGEYYRRLGYIVIDNVNTGADGGVDITLQKNGTKTIIQCKHWKANRVGVKEIREFYAILMHMQAGHAIFITSGFYTSEAKIFAQGKPIVLIDGRQLESMIAQVQNNDMINSPKPHVIMQNQHLSAIPSCPKCGSEMIMRRSRRGETAGSEFWGCTDYPKCHGTRNID